jgi:hypothetical protein
VEERAACALLKQRFEAAGFTIEDNRPFDEDGVRFEIDGFDPRHRVGYEYTTDEAGDSWDVDDAVIAALDERRRRGELHVLIVRAADAPDAESLGRAADAFLAELRECGIGATQTTEPAPAARAAIESPQPAASHDVARSQSAPDEANLPPQIVPIPDEAELEPAQTIAAMEQVQATEAAEPAHTKPAHTGPTAAESARRSDPESAHAERGAESAPTHVNSEPDALATPSGKSRAKKTSRSPTSKPKSVKPKPPAASGKSKSANRKATRK